MFGDKPSIFGVGSGSVALLIDGENISPNRVNDITAQAEKHGELVIKRVYGDATAIPGWQKMPGFRLINSGSGKNAADILLAIQAVDFAQKREIKNFVIASSDGDFSHLAHFLRERGIRVIGVGETKAPESFRRSCSAFVEIRATGMTTSVPRVVAPCDQEESNINQMVIRLLRENPDGRGMEISRLGGKMHALHKIRISTRAEKNWRTYLTNRPALFDCDPRGAAARVRLK